jgi:hypothetical protein
MADLVGQVVRVNGASMRVVSARVDDDGQAVIVTLVGDCGAEMVCMKPAGHDGGHHAAPSAAPDPTGTETE